MAPPKKSSKGSGFQSAAGLMRYFDSEDDAAPKIPPRAVLAVCFALIVIVELSKYLWPY